MILLWLFFALLTVGVVVALTRPLATASAGVGETDATDLAIYKDQLAELEADKSRGLITEREAEAARIEIARRMLGRAARTNDPDAASKGWRLSPEKLFLGVAAAVPALALLIYLPQGSPQQPGSPNADRVAQATADAKNVAALISRVETRLRQEPKDGQGWDVIAPIYLRIGRFQDSADAFQRAMELQGVSARRLLGHAEALIRASDGIVTEPARKDYLKVLELEPDRLEAKFGLALAKEQDGELVAAEQAYREMLPGIPQSSPWREIVDERLEDLSARKKGGAAGLGAKPDAAGAAQVAGLPPAEQRAAIMGMVQALEARLSTDGKDVAGWQRLIRSWQVLGQKEKAAQALADARKALSADAKALGEINAFAKDLGF